jgi:hypothetical protein
MDVPTQMPATGPRLEVAALSSDAIEKTPAAPVDQIREVFVTAMVDMVRTDEAHKAGGALVSLTPEYEAEITAIFGLMFDKGVAALVTADASVAPTVDRDVDTEATA